MSRLSGGATLSERGASVVDTAVRIAALTTAAASDELETDTLLAKLFGGKVTGLKLTA